MSIGKQFYEFKSLYEVLGISKTATDEEIKRAYRVLAKKHHPDKTGSKDDSMFKSIGQAYEILSNPDKKIHMMK